MKNFEHNFNIGNYDKEPNDDFNNLIQKLTENNSILADILKEFTDEERENFDMAVLNPGGLSWGAFNAISSENEARVLDLINSFKSTKEKDGQNKIAKELVEILER